MPTSGCGLVYFAVCFDSANPRHHYISSVPQHAISIAGRAEIRFYRMNTFTNQQKSPYLPCTRFPPFTSVCYSSNVKRLALLKREGKIKLFLKVAELVP